jgi:hypothetical protein
MCVKEPLYVCKRDLVYVLRSTTSTLSPTPPSSIDMYNNDVGKRFMK